MSGPKRSRGSVDVAAGRDLRRIPCYTMHDGFRMPMGFPVQAFASALDYRARRGDVLVATYPKCGTTWMQYIVYLLLNRAEPLSKGASLADVFPHLEEVGAAAVQALPPPRMIKSHLRFSMLPVEPGARYVYVARNPFDCAVSFFHHTRGFVQHYDFAEGTFEDFFECFVAGEVDFGDYFDHLIDAWRHKDADNVLLVRYEDLLADPDATIVRVGRFLGDAIAEAVADAGFVARVRDASSFSRMSVDQRRWSSARPAGMPEFVRKGVAGDWRNHFSPRQAGRLIREFEQRTGRSGPFELWPEIAAEVREYAEST